MTRFVDAKRALAIHDLQIAEHGGAPGIRDLGLLESALARAINIAEYEATKDISRLGAAYLFGSYSQGTLSVCTEPAIVGYRTPC